MAGSPCHAFRFTLDVAESLGEAEVPHGPRAGSLHDRELCEPEESVWVSYMQDVEGDLKEDVK